MLKAARRWWRNTIHSHEGSSELHGDIEKCIKALQGVLVDIERSIEDLPIERTAITESAQFNLQKGAKDIKRTIGILGTTLQKYQYAPHNDFILKALSELRQQEQQELEFMERQEEMERKSASSYSLEVFIQLTRRNIADLDATIVHIRKIEALRKDR